LAGKVEQAILDALALATTSAERIEFTRQLVALAETKSKNKKISAQKGKAMNKTKNSPSRNFTPEQIAARRAKANPQPTVSKEQENLETAVKFFESQIEEKSE